MPDTDTPLHFAYGSNLYPPRLQARTPSARYHGAALLGGHALRFHKRGTDGSGKADAHPTGEVADGVWGVLYTLDGAEKPALDAIEGPGYEEVLVHVRTTLGGDLPVWMYRARPEWHDTRLRPFEWYRSYVVAGARHHGFPASYTRTVLEVEAVPDPDLERRHAAEAILSAHADVPGAESPDRT